MNDITLLVNPKSSKYDFRIMKKCEKLLTQKGNNVKIMRTSNISSAFIPNFEQKLHKAQLNSDMVICYGGDGIYGLMCRYFNRNLQTCPIGFIPIGTANDMAENLNISTNPVEATEQILDGTVKEHDIISVNNVGFGYVSAFGPITNTTYEIDPSLKKRLGKFGYVINAKDDIKNVILQKHKPYKISYTTNGKKVNTEALIGLVTNAKKFSGISLYDDVKLDDGLFEMLLIKPEIIDVAPNIIKDFIFSFSKNKSSSLIEDYPDVFETVQTDDLKITFDNTPEKPFNNDGDKGLVLSDDNKDVHYKINSSIDLLVPSNKIKTKRLCH